MERSSAGRRFRVVQGGGEGERLDRFLDADPLLLVSLQDEERGLRRRRLRHAALAGAFGLALAIPAFLLATGVLGPSGRTAAPDREKAVLLTEDGWKLHFEDRHNEALANFNLATRLAPGLAKAWEGIAICQTDLYQSELAEQAFLRSLAIDPRSESAIDGLGNLYLRRGDERRAEETWVRGGRERQLARLYLLQGKFAQAEARLASVLRGPQPPEDDLLYQMARAARSRRLDPTLRSLLEPEPTGRSAWADLGWRLYNEKRYAEAAAAFDEAISKVPSDVNALGGMGRALLDMGRPEEARVYFERALWLDDDHVLSLDGFALSLKNEGNVQEAIRVWQEMSARYPGVNIGTPGLAWTYYEIQDYGQAAVQFARLIRRHPYDSRLAEALNVAVENLAGPRPH
jgi:tetratricopeptide (TPR) repeat protein